jgi:hypothetical protein
LVIRCANAGITVAQPLVDAKMAVASPPAAIPTFPPERKHLIEGVQVLAGEVG